MRTALLLGLVLTAAGAGAAQAHTGETSPTATARAIETPCPGEPIVPHKVITGALPSSLQGSHVMVPFTVPAGTTAVRIKYCFDQPDAPTSSQVKHTLDLGVFDPDGFRGWGGSSHPDVWISPEGFTTEAQYRENPRRNVPGKTTRAYTPGPISAGVWAAELGAAAIAGAELGDSDGAVNWRVELHFSTEPSHADEPYVPAAYDAAPARAEPGWYQGDLHVHAEHSALGDATMTEVFDYAFKQRALDFLTLSDYVTTSGWGEIGRHQPNHPGRLITRSSEVITPRGHTNNHSSGRYVDHRTGPVYELRPDGTLQKLREARPASEIFDAVRGAGGWTQVNHPTIFPSEVPGFALQCRGCPWDYSDADTDWSKVDAYEVATGPGGAQQAAGIGFNPFTATAIAEYERLLAAGHHIAAVGVSDSHHAGRTNNPVTQSPIGQATTVVGAPALSEAGIRCGVRAGHTYVKVWGPDRPGLALAATAPGLAGSATFGDTIRAAGVRLAVTVTGAGPRDGTPFALLVLRDGVVVDTRPLQGGTETFEFAAGAPGRYGLRLMRGISIEAVSTPVWVEDPGATPEIIDRGCTPQHGANTVLRLRVGAPRGLTVTCRLRGGFARTCAVAARAKRRTLARGTARFGRDRTARVRLRLTGSGRAALRRRRSVRVTLTARANRGAQLALDRRSVRLRR